jgi:hypothetical protein
VRLSGRNWGSNSRNAEKTQTKIAPNTHPVSNYRLI